MAPGATSINYCTGEQQGWLRGAMHASAVAAEQHDIYTRVCRHAVCVRACWGSAAPAQNLSTRVHDDKFQQLDCAQGIAQNLTPERPSPPAACRLPPHAPIADICGAGTGPNTGYNALTVPCWYCSKGTYSPGGTFEVPKPNCTKCPDGWTTNDQLSGAASVSDCKGARAAEGSHPR